jgi:hypothetical protein
MEDGRWTDSKKRCFSSNIEIVIEFGIKHIIIWMIDIKKLDEILWIFELELNISLNFSKQSWVKHIPITIHWELTL